jgi:L-alanine-DL-glutamate epimerase-like enolase superfamily enzyme
LKIRDIEAIHLRVEDPNIGLFDGSYDACVIRVTTDEGLVGIGEVESLPAAVQAIVRSRPAHSHAWGLRELLVGRDPTRPRELWQLMFESTDYVGRRGLMMHAIGGVDIALWDIAAQAAGKPVSALLGGRRRERIEAYGTLYPLGRTEGEVRRQVRAALDELHLNHLKLCGDPWWFDDPDRTAGLLRAARREMGPQRGLIIDAALMTRAVDPLLRLVPIFKELGVLFLEAPLPLDDVEGHARVAAAGLPIGVGDLGLTHVNEFVEMIERGGASILQPDITMVGGFTGILQIAEAVRKRGKRVMPHGYKTNIEISANLHFLSNHPDVELLEFSTSRSPLRWEATIERLPVASDGFVDVPRGPGLGVRLDPRVIERYRVD